MQDTSTCYWFSYRDMLCKQYRIEALFIMSSEILGCKNCRLADIVGPPILPLLNWALWGCLYGDCNHCRALKHLWNNVRHTFDTCEGGKTARECWTPVSSWSAGTALGRNKRFSILHQINCSTCSGISSESFKILLECMSMAFRVRLNTIASVHGGIN